MQLNEDGSSRTQLHFSYYLERQLINPLQRLFGLCGFSVQDCFKRTALFCIRNQAVIGCNALLNQEKFRQLLGYFSKLSYKGV